MKRWRLFLSRELDCRAYEIFQDRTLCEIVRRRRNDPEWARFKPGQNEIALVNAQLQECWGIGPSKVKEGGFAHQVITIMNEREDIAELLRQSNLLSGQNDEVKAE